MHRDLCYALRVLLKSPGFTAVALLSLALGIGANTTVFTLINAVFLHPLPVEEPARLVSLYTSDEKSTAGFLTFLPVSRLNYGGNPNLVGKLTLNNHASPLWKSAPEGFRGTNALGAPDFWVPLMMHEQGLSGNFRTFFTSRQALLFNVVGRLKPGVASSRPRPP